MKAHRPSVRKAIARIRGDMLDPRNWERTGCEDATSELCDDSCDWELKSTANYQFIQSLWNAFSLLYELAEIKNTSIDT